MHEARDSGGSRWAVAGLVAAVLLALVAMLPFASSVLVLPWGRDQGIYAFSAWQALSGLTPYTEIFIFKPPGTVFVHMGSQLLFGPSMVAVRAMDVLWTLSTGLALFWLARKATGRALAGVFAAMVYAWSAANLTYWSSSQTDSWVNLFYALALVLVLWDPSPRSRPWLGLASGLVFGGAFWLKYTTGALLPLIMVLPLLQFGLRDRRAWLTFIAIGAGFVASVLAVLGWLWLNGALSEFFAIQKNIVLPYTGVTGDQSGVKRRSLSKFLSGVERFGTAQLTLWGLGAAGTIALVIARLWTSWGERLDARTLAAIAAVGWVACGLLSGFIQGKFWMYQMMTTVGGGALLSAIGLWTLASGVRGRWAAALAVCWLLWASGGRFPNRWSLLSRYATADLTADAIYRKGTYRNGGFSLKQAMDVAVWLKAETEPGDRIFVWGYDPMIYVMADRRPVSRFPYHYAQIVPWGPDSYDDELLADLREHPPRMFVVPTKDSVSIVTKVKKHSDQLLEEWAELQAFVDEGYRRRTRIGRYTVYERR